jgi:hypothetical protein
VTVGEAPQRGRPLFDFFGLGSRHDEGDARQQQDDVREQGDAVAPPSSTPVPIGRAAKTDPGKSRLARQRQRRVIMDQANAPSPDSDDGSAQWGGRRSNGDTWDRDHRQDDGWHRDWNNNRDDE